MRQVDNTTGPIYECGTGLTTLVLDAMLDEDREREVHCFEHEYKWFQRVSSAMEFEANIWPHLCDLRSTQLGLWYDIKCLRLPKMPAGLIIVDGPPGGHRNGYLIGLGQHIDGNTVILCDDAERDWDDIEQARNYLHGQVDFLPADRGIAIIHNCEVAHG